jgi:hypothetical protein
MAAIFVASYSLQVFEKMKTASPLPLAFTDGKSLREEVWKVLSSMQPKPVRHETEPHLLQLKTIFQDGADIFGTLERGEFGFSSRGIKADTFAASYKRSANDAEMIPYYFRFHLPDEEYNGFLIIQRLGTHSPYTDVRDRLMQAFREANPGHRLRVGALVPSELLEQLQKGKIKTLKVVVHKKTGDKADSFLKGTEETLGTIEQVYRAKRDHALWPVAPSWLKDIMTGKTKIVKVFPQAERIAVGVDYNGRTRTFDVSERDDAAPYIDISKVVKLSDGHPVFDEINEYAEGLVEDLRGQLGMAGG